MDNKQRREEEKRRTIREMCIMDDPFMNAVFNDNIDAANLMLRIILDNPSISVKSVTVQKRLPNIYGHDVILDIHAFDGKTMFDCEVPNARKGADPQRARYHVGLMDMSSLPEGENYDKLPESYVIFITEKDYFRRGSAVYSFNRYDEKHMMGLQDGSHILYVNGSYRGDDRLGKLMHDFRCTNAEDMNYNELRDRARHLKETEEGGMTMSRTFDRMMEEERREGFFEGRVEGREEGREEGRAFEARRMDRLISELLTQNRLEDLKKATSDTGFKENLFKEFSI